VKQTVHGTFAIADESASMLVLTNLGEKVTAVVSTARG
jgi:hypothetical protein